MYKPDYGDLLYEYIEASGNFNDEKEWEKFQREKLSKKDIEKVETLEAKFRDVKNRRHKMYLEYFKCLERAVEYETMDEKLYEEYESLRAKKSEIIYEKCDHCTYGEHDFYIGDRLSLCDYHIHSSH